MNPTVTVCISTFNRCDDLQRCVSSILQQDYENLKLVIYDNASDDDTPKWLQAYQVWFPSIIQVIFGKRDPNAMITLNKTFRAAKENGSEYVLVMDDDAYLPADNVITKLVACMVDNVAIVGANVKSPNGSCQMPVRNRAGVLKTTLEIDQLGLYSNIEFHGACALFDVEKCNALGWYDESFTIYMNELDLSTKALNAGYMVLVRSDAVAMHRGVGYKNACNIRAYYFIRNYNTVLTRNFRTLTGRLKAVTLHTFMNTCYFAERILIYNVCENRLKIVKFSYLMIKAYIIAIYRSVFPDERHQWRDHQYFEDCMYNGFKHAIKTRIRWINRRSPLQKVR